MPANTLTYQREYQRAWRAHRRPYRSTFPVIRALREVLEGHCCICGLLCVSGTVCQCCLAEIEGRPLPRC